MFARASQGFLPKDEVKRQIETFGKHLLPRLIDLYMKKKLKLDELVTRTYALDEVNAAMTALEKGEVVRSVIVM